MCLKNYINKEHNFGESMKLIDESLLKENLTELKNII